MISPECINFTRHAAREARFPVIVIGDTQCEITPHIAIATEEGRSAHVITVNAFKQAPHPLEAAHNFLCKVRNMTGTHSLFMCPASQAARVMTSPVSLVHLSNGTGYAEVKDVFILWAAKIHPQGWFIIQGAGTTSPWEGPKKVVEEILYNPDSVPLKWGNIQVGPDFTALKRLR